MHFQIKRDQGCTIVTASGPEIQLESKDELYSHAEAGDLAPRQIILNLQHVVNFKSAILGVLVQFQRRVEKAGGKLKVVCPDPDVLLMFHITKVDLVFDLYSDEQLAIDAFGSQTPSFVAMK